MTPEDSSDTAAPASEEELVTVVIPARNEEKAIRKCVDSIREQSWTNLQILVVDGASDDATCDIVTEISEQDPRVQLLHNPEGIIPISLNVALAEAKADYLVRVDAHAHIPTDYVAGVMAHFREHAWGGVGGRKDGIGETPAGRAIAVAMASPFGVGNSTYHHGTEVQTVDHIPFGAYPVALARELGGWDPNLRVNQDFEFDHRIQEAGYELIFDPNLVIGWESRQTIRALYSQYKRYGRGKVKVMAKHPESINPRHLVAPALVTWSGLALGKLLRGRPRTAAAMMAPYVIGLGVASAVASRDLEEKSDAVYLPAAFAAMHYGWGQGFWLGIGDLVSSRLRPSNG